MYIYGKQLLHTKERLKTVALSAYGVIENRPDGIFAGRTDEDDGLLFTVLDKDDLFEYLKGLRDGIKQEEFAERLKDFIGEEEAADFTDRLIQGGVIE